jgi:membrane-bound serine protease (ClpP class)
MFLVFAGAAAVAGTVRADADAPSSLAPVDVVPVSGLVDEVVADAIEVALVRAAGNGAQAVVLQVNSRGAVISRERMSEVLAAVSASPVPVAVWVGPTGARAYGLSVQLLAVADVTAMAPGARIGHSGKLLEVDGTTVTFGLADAVLRTSSLGFDEARTAGVLRYAGGDDGVPVIRNMLLALDGVQARGAVLDTVAERVDADGQVVRDATTARFFKLGLAGQLMHTVASPPVAYLLVAAGLALLIFEFFTAGIGIAGATGAVCGVLGCYGFASLPVRPLAVLVLVLAFVAFAIDVQVGVPRLWTGIGSLLFVGSSLSLYQPIDGSSMRLPWVTLVAGIASILLAFVAGMPSMVRTRFATPTIGREWLVGQTGSATTGVDPEGFVEVAGASWRARTNRATPLSAGSSCRVAGIDGVTLLVEPLEGAARDYRERGRRDGRG